MALFENFPYTNLHELNLDWLINELKRIQDTQVLSVNGMTGDVVLYEDAQVVLPAIQGATWSFFRDAAGTVRGITFDSDGTAYIMAGSQLYKVYTSKNSPDFDAQYVRLGTLTDEEMMNWNIYRTINGTVSGIQFDDDGTAYIMSGMNRYKVYSQKDDPPYPVTSVNGQTGTVVLYPDNTVRLPDISDATLDYWNIFRWMGAGNGYYGLQFNTDGTIELITPGARTQIYTATNQPPYPVTSVNGQTGTVSLNIPPDFVVDVDEDMMEVSQDASAYTWGLVRTTDNGSIGISFDNQNGNKAYLTYWDSVNEKYVTTQLLSLADIPSTTGVVSVNGMTGVVNVYATNTEMSSLDSTPVSTVLGNLGDFSDLLAQSLAIIVNGDSASVAIPAGALILVINSTIANINDGLYEAVNAISANTSLSSPDLTDANTNNGGFNTLLNKIPVIKTYTIESGTTTANCQLAVDPAVITWDNAIPLAAFSTDNSYSYFPICVVQAGIKRIWLHVRAANSANAGVASTAITNVTLFYIER